MSGVVVIEQPNYIPWLGYFDLLRQSDIWVWYDDVQYTKRDWRNRNRVAAAAPFWLTIPVKNKGRYQQRICDVEIDYSDLWPRRHLETIRRCYGRAPFFELVFETMRDALGAGHLRLADLTIELCESLGRILGLSPRYARSSRLPPTNTTSQQRLIELCHQLEGAVYLSGPAARAYIAPAAFTAAEIELRYIVYGYPPYDRGRQPFVPQLSIVDALAWLGPAETMAFLAAHGSKWEIAS